MLDADRCGGAERPGRIVTKRCPTLHYPTPAARRADFVIHIVGLALAAVGAAVMLTFVAGGQVGRVAATAIYAAGLIMMLAFSTAYNFASERRRPFLRRLDHAGIFVMIAGSYTPFTTQILTGAWAWGMTAAVWSIAGLGILGKLVVPQLREWIWIALYLSMGWIVVVAIGPIMAGLSRPAMILLAAGGLIYTLGVVFHLSDRLQFSRSIWHGHVLAGAGIHWVAILIGTVLPTQ